MWKLSPEDLHQFKGGNGAHFGHLREVSHFRLGEAGFALCGRHDADAGRSLGRVVRGLPRVRKNIQPNRRIITGFVPDSVRPKMAVLRPRGGLPMSSSFPSASSKKRCRPTYNGSSCAVWDRRYQDAAALEKALAACESTSQW